MMTYRQKKAAKTAHRMAYRAFDKVLSLADDLRLDSTCKADDREAAIVDRAAVKTAEAMELIEKVMEKYGITEDDLLNG